MTSPPAGWDESAVRSPGGHVLQSVAWAALRERQGWRAEFVRIGSPLPVALVLWRSLPLGKLMGYVPRGPIVAPNDTAGLARALAALADLARSRRVLFLKVDPELATETAVPVLRDAGFARGPDVQPVLATLVLDLAPSEDELMARLEKDTRWSVRAGEKRGVRVRDAATDSDLRAFYDLYSGTGARAGFITRTWEYYRDVWRALISAGHATLWLAELEGQPVAGAMIWRCGDRELYMYGASNEAGRKAYASYVLQWRCIMGAKRAGARRYDLGGIPVDPERKDDPMHGPYLFKKGFGGVIVRYSGAFDTVANPLGYRAFRALEPFYTRILRARG